MMHHQSHPAQSEHTPSPLLDAALDAAAHGWAVLPCHPAGARAKSPIGQLVPHGHHDASTDPAVITAWWTRWPAAMIGAAVPASLLVLDVDPRNGGSVADLQHALGVLPPTLTAWSGRGDGGRHLYYLRPAGTLTAARLPRGVDLKAAGYVILPPSVHPATGAPYRWEHAPVAYLPREAITALRPPRRPAPPPRRGRASPGTVAALVRTVAAASEGTRSDVLYWAARRALERHDDGALEELVEAAVSVGLSEREARATTTSATRAHQGAR